MEARRDAVIRDRIKMFKRIKASELQPHPQNWRTHPQAQRDAMAGILTEVGYVDALMVREYKGGYQILDGHLRAETTPDTEVPVLVVDLDDAEAALVLSTFDPLAALATIDSIALDGLLRDVSTSDTALQAMLAELAKDAGLYLSESGGSEEAAESQYTNKITAPIYEPKGERPPIKDLSDKTKTNELCNEIEKAGLPDEVRGFLLTAAQRHTVFNFRNIAEFYCHASADVQHLMERSGLIIIDMDKAIANGFVHLSERLGAIADLELSEAEDA